MKTILRIALVAAVIVSMTGCDAFKTLNKSKKSAQGKPYELIVVCPQACLLYTSPSPRDN